MKISIITICYNSSRHIEQTIESVVNQTFLDKEYIVVDGGSTDGTIDIIKKYEGKIDKFVSESDSGIADAMNKGLLMASGDFVIFLHSDDYFYDENVLSAASSYLLGSCDILLFNIFLSDKGRVRLFKPRGFNWWLNLKTGVFHQSAICARTLFERIGNFDTNFRVAMDYDFFLRAFRSGVQARKINHSLSVMRLSGVSSQLDGPSVKKRIDEERQAHMKNCPSTSMQILYRIYWLFYPAFKLCKSKVKGLRNFNISSIN